MNGYGIDNLFATMNTLKIHICEYVGQVWQGSYPTSKQMQHTQDTRRNGECGYGREDDGVRWVTIKDSRWLAIN